MAKRKASGKTAAIQQVLEAVAGNSGETPEGLLQFVQGNGLQDLATVRGENRMKNLEAVLETAVMQKGKAGEKSAGVAKEILKGLGLKQKQNQQVIWEKMLSDISKSAGKSTAAKATSSALSTAAMKGPNGILASILNTVKGSVGKVAGGLGIIDILALLMGNMYLGQRQQGMDVALQNRMLDVNAGAVNPDVMTAQKMAPYEEQRMGMAQQAMMNQLGGGQIATGESIIGG